MKTKIGLILIIIGLIGLFGNFQLSFVTVEVNQILSITAVFGGVWLILADIIDHIVKFNNDKHSQRLVRRLNGEVEELRLLNKSLSTRLSREKRLSNSRYATICKLKKN
jgi:hypothetical protein